MPVYPFDRNAPPLFDAAHLCTAYGAVSYPVHIMEIYGRDVRERIPAVSDVQGELTIIEFRLLLGNS